MRTQRLCPTVGRSSCMTIDTLVLLRMASARSGGAVGEVAAAGLAAPLLRSSMLPFASLSMLALLTACQSIPSASAVGSDNELAVDP